MKKILLVVLILIVAIIGGVAIKGTLNTKTELMYDPLSEKENILMKLTGNNVIMYKIKNIPKGKIDELTMTYEVYENNKKIKDEMLIGLNGGQINTKKENRSIGIGFQDNKIRIVSSSDGCSVSSEYSVKEDLKKYNSTHFLDNVSLKPGEEVYLYYATKNDSIRGDIPLGVPIDQETITEFLTDRKSTILIKLSYNEVV